MTLINLYNEYIHYRYEGHTVTRIQYVKMCKQLFKPASLLYLLFTAMILQPGDPLMYKLRADIRGKMGMTKEAIEDYEQAIYLLQQ